MKMHSSFLIKNTALSVALLSIACKNKTQEPPSETQGNGPVSRYESSEAQATYQIKNFFHTPAESRF